MLTSAFLPCNIFFSRTFKQQERQMNAEKATLKFRRIIGEWEIVVLKLGLTYFAMAVHTVKQRSGTYATGLSLGDAIRGCNQFLAETIS